MGRRKLIWESNYPQLQLRSLSLQQIIPTTSELFCDFVCRAEWELLLALDGDSLSDDLSHFSLPLWWIQLIKFRFSTRCNPKLVSVSGEFLISLCIIAHVSSEESKKALKQQRSRESWDIHASLFPEIMLREKYFLIKTRFDMQSRAWHVARHTLHSAAFNEIKKSQREIRSL